MFYGVKQCLDGFLSFWALIPSVNQIFCLFFFFLYVHVLKVIRVSHKGGGWLPLQVR